LGPLWGGFQWLRGGRQLQRRESPLEDWRRIWAGWLWVLICGQFVLAADWPPDKSEKCDRGGRQVSEAADWPSGRAEKWKKFISKTVLRFSALHFERLCASVAQTVAGGRVAAKPHTVSRSLRAAGLQWRCRSGPLHCARWAELELGRRAN